MLFNINFYLPKYLAAETLIVYYEATKHMLNIYTIYLHTMVN